jgi:hypothetical protein
MKKNIILGVVCVLLIASLITNFVLIKKIGTKEKVKEVAEETITGIYFNENGGTLEFKDDNTFITRYGFEQKYKIEGNDIIVSYYDTAVPEEDGKCYTYGMGGEYKEEIPCKEKREYKIRKVEGGLLYDNKIYRKIG